MEHVLNVFGGDNPGVEVRQNTRGKRIRFYFLVSCELYMGRSSLPFHVQDPLERFEIADDPRLIFLARLDSLGMGFRACCSPCAWTPLPRPLAVGFSPPRVLAIDSSLMSLLRKATRCSTLYMACGSTLTPTPRENRVFFAG